MQAVAGDGHTSTVAQLNIVAGAGLTELPIGVTIPVGREPGLPVFADDALWVPSTLDGTVERIDPDTNRVAATIAVASYAHPLTRGTWTNALAAGAGSIWDVVDSADTLVRIDPATNAVSARILVPGASQAVVGAGAVWVTDFDQPRVYRIDPATNTVAATILLPIRRDQTQPPPPVSPSAGVPKSPRLGRTRPAVVTRVRSR